MAWLTGWNRRKSISINSTTNQSDYQMKITVHRSGIGDTSTDVYCGNNCRTDLGDIRFTSSDGTTISYWIDPSTLITGTNATAIFWIKIPFISIGTGAASIYMYYDNPAGTYTGSEYNTFTAADFTTFTSVDPGGNLSISSSRVTFTNLHKNTNTYLYKPITPIGDYRYDFEYTISGGGSIPQDDGYVLMGGVADSANNLWLSINALYTRCYNAFHISTYRLYMESRLGGVMSEIPPGDNYANVSPGPIYYVTITRIGTTVSMYVYSDAARTTQIGGSPRIGTISPEVAFGYVLPITSLYNNQTTGYVNGYVQNARLRKYTSPEPTFGIISTEETYVPANIFISDIKIGTADCPCATAPTTPCATTLTCSPIICTSIGCSASTDTIQTISITFANNGGINGNIIALSLIIGTGTPISYVGGPILVPANTNTTTATFSNVTLVRGSNSINITYTWQ